MPANLDVNGTRLRVTIAGEGRPILFLHGNGGEAAHWAPQVDALRGEFRCVVPDQRGFGASAPLDGVPSLGLYADDAAAVCAALEHRHVIVVGLSMGGLIAQALAIRHPPLVEGLLLAGCPTLAVASDGPRPPAIDAGIVGRLMNASFTPEFRAAHSDVVERLVLAAQRDQTVATVKGWLAAPTAASEGLASEAVRCPTLVVGADLDDHCPSPAVDDLARAIPGSERATIGGASHLMNIEQDEVFTQLVRRFTVALSPS